MQGKAFCDGFSFENRRAEVEGVQERDNGRGTETRVKEPTVVLITDGGGGTGALLTSRSQRNLLWPYSTVSALQHSFNISS